MESFKKGSDEFNFMGEFYNFCKKFYEPKDTKKYWSELVAEAESLNKKYGETEFTSELILGFINYAEFKAKEKGVRKWRIKIEES